MNLKILLAQLIQLYVMMCIICLPSSIAQNNNLLNNNNNEQFENIDQSISFEDDDILNDNQSIETNFEEISQNNENLQSDNFVNIQEGNAEAILDEDFVNQQNTNNQGTNNIQSLPANTQNISNSQIMPNTNQTTLQEVLTEQEVPIEQLNPTKEYIRNDFIGANMPGTRRILNPGEAPFEYVIQAGDTLYDVCDQLLDDPYYWPMLWAMNPHIKNPHFIDPNTVVRFFPNVDSKAPEMSVAVVDDVLPINQDQLTATELQPVVPPLPLLQVANKVVDVGEEDTIEVLDGAGFPVSDETYSEFVFQGKSFDDDRIHIMIPGFILKDEPKELASVIGGRNGDHLVGDDLQVLLKGKESLNAGTTYTVIRPYYHKMFTEFQKAGTFYEFIANVKVERELNTKGAYLGTIQSQLKTGVEPGDMIVAYRSSMRTIPSPTEIGTPSNIQEARAIAFGMPGGQIGGEGDLVYIDKGKDSGIAEGQYVKFHLGYGSNATKDIRDMYPSRDVDNFQVNVARVIDVSDNNALAYIMKSDYEISIGDFTRP